MKSLVALTPEELRRAAAIQEKIQDLQKELQKIFGVTPGAEAATAPGKRTLSAAGRAAIRAAQTARWAKAKGNQPAQKATRRFSAATKAKMAAAMKARWAKAKQSGKGRL